MVEVTAGVPLPFEVTFPDGVGSYFVALKIRDVTLGYPGTLVATTAMVHLGLGTYGANFTATAGKAYQASKAAYTDGTFATPLPDMPAGSESFYAKAAATPLDPAQVASAVWDALLADYDDAGSFGEFVQNITSGGGGGSGGDCDLTGSVDELDTLVGVVDDVDAIAGEIEDC